MIYAAIALTDKMGEYSSVREKTELESAAAYSLLSALYEKIYGAAMPDIAKDERGKPYFLGKGVPSFNISHTDGASLAVIDTSASAIGADIQIEVSADKAERIYKRFPFVKNASCAPPIADYKLFTLYTERLTEPPLENTPILDTELSDFSARWAFTEALLKAEGGGFMSACRIESIRAKHSLSFKLKEYCFSIVSL